MLVSEAQREVRTVFRGGLAGGLVSGAIWLASSALATWSSPRAAILALVIGGMFIFPLTVLVLKLMGGPAALRKENPLGALGMQVAFTVPLALPVIGAATLRDLNWFYPAFMIVVGAHYLPFIFLYGMKLFAALAAILILAGVAIGLHFHHAFALGGWFTGAVLILFGLAGGATVAREARAGR